MAEFFRASRRLASRDFGVVLKAGIRDFGFGIAAPRFVAALLFALAPLLFAPGAALAQTLSDAASPDESTSPTEIPNPESESPALEISLLTIGPGPIFWERFGHNAIVVRDRDSGTAIAYNYGIFDFEQENFLANFARGNMRYRIAADDITDDIAMYR